MAVETDDDRAAFVHADDFGQSGTYTPAVGAAVPLSLLLDQPHEVADLGGAGVLDVGWRARIRAADVAAPANGDTLAVGARSFRVRNARQDLTGAMWLLDLEIQ